MDFYFDISGLFRDTTLLSVFEILYMEEQSEEDFCNSFPNLSETVEYSKDKRFSRTSKILAEGKYKTVFLGYDHDSSREIAWSVIKLTTITIEEKDQITKDFFQFSKLNHPNILKLIDYWENNEKNHIVTITELTNCSLKQYLRKKMQVRLKVIKEWCRSILEVIKYLYSRTIVHKNIKNDNIFISSSDGNIRVGVFGHQVIGNLENQGLDLRSFAYCVIELCTLTELDYAKVYTKTIPRETLMIDNQKIRDFVSSCFIEDSPDSLLGHLFLKNDGAADSSPIKIIPNEDQYEAFIEEVPKTPKCRIIILKNSEIICKHEFNCYEDVSEQIAELIISKYSLPSNYFETILNTIEHHVNAKPCLNSSSEPISNPFPLASESKGSKKLKFSINLGIQDLSNIKKLKIDILYDPDTDTSTTIAEEIINHFQLEHSETNSICRLINEKILNSESETYSNYSNQDLLDLTIEDSHQRAGLGSTTEFSIPSECSSYRSSSETQNMPELNNSRSLSPIDEEEKVIICARGRKNDPKDVKQLQETLGNFFGFKIQSDGVFCKNTEQQVKLFQEEVGLNSNGIVCTKLWSVIRNYKNLPIRNI
jgi:serine/threonine protein kinase